MQNNDRPASPVIELPTHDHPRSLAAKVQPRRLTDSHRRGSNPRRGFELMKKGGACSGSKQSEQAHWRDVNPARASSALSSFAMRARICGAKRVAPAKMRQKRITSVDNVMTLR
jgi:hypothetical protein